MSAITASVTLRGGLFGKNIPKVVERQIVEHILRSVQKRVERGGKGLGEQRNTTTTDISGLTLTERFTRRRPRVSGRAKIKKQIGQVKAIAPRSGRKAAEMIAAEMGR